MGPELVAAAPEHRTCLRHRQRSRPVAGGGGAVGTASPWGGGQTPDQRSPHPRETMTYGINAISWPARGSEKTAAEATSLGIRVLSRLMLDFSGKSINLICQERSSLTPPLPLGALPGPAAQVR